jgi:hypothetical protein
MNIAASDLIGTWILQSAVFRFEDDGESVEFYGARPTGVATFTKEGRLIAILSSGDPARDRRRCQQGPAVRCRDGL